MKQFERIDKQRGAGRHDERRLDKRLIGIKKGGMVSVFELAGPFSAQQPKAEGQAQDQQAFLVGLQGVVFVIVHSQEKDHIDHQVEQCQRCFGFIAPVFVGPIGCQPPGRWSSDRRDNSLEEKV